MKGVSMIRVKEHPVAECQHTNCGWVYAGRSYIAATTVRATAERHVVQQGHIVTVTIRDITEYSPESRAQPDAPAVTP